MSFKPLKLERRHFEFVADRLREGGASLELASHFANELAKTNGQFNRQKFLERCQATPSKNT